MQHAHRDFTRRDFFERADNRLERTLDIRFDHDRQFLRHTGRDLREHLLESSACACCSTRVAPAALTEVGDVARAALVLCNYEIVARERCSVEPQHLDRTRRTRLEDVLPAIVEQCAHASPFAARDKDVADPQRAALDEHGCNRTAPPLEFGFEHDPLGGTVRVGPQVEQLGLQQNQLLELVEVGLF